MNLHLHRWRRWVRRSSWTGRRSSARRATRLRFDCLEERRLLATVTWDGGGGNFDWNNAANWDTDPPRVPAAEDVVVIDLDATFTVDLSSSATIAGLTLGGASGSQTLNFVAPFQTLTINGPAVIEPNGTLIVTEFTTVDGTGRLTNRGTVESRQGGTINLPFDNATVDSVVRFGNDSCCSVATLLFGQGFTNHGLIESTSFQGRGSVLRIGDGTGTLVNAPDGRIHVVPGPAGGPRQFLLTLDNQGTLILDHSLDLLSGAAHDNSGSILLQGGSLKTSVGPTGSSFANTGQLQIGAGQTFRVEGAGSFFSPQGFSNQGGTIGGQGTLQLTGLSAHFTTDIEFDETTLQTRIATINGPGTLHLLGGDTKVERSTINAPIVNDAILTFTGSGNINGPFTANPGSTLRISSVQSSNGSLTFATGLTNHGLIELTSVATVGGPASLNVTNGELVNAPEGIIRALAGNFGGTRAINAPVDNQGLIEVLETDLPSRAR